MPVPVVPSPKSHAYDTMLPSGSCDGVASKLHERLLQLDVNLAIGGWSLLTVGTRMFFENSDVSPPGFVVVAVTIAPPLPAGSVTLAMPVASAVPDAR